jgi:hypothetical protein
VVVLDAQVTEQADGTPQRADRDLAAAAPAGFRLQRLLSRRWLVDDIVAQLDAQPLGEARPATSWQPGEVLTTQTTRSTASPRRATCP